MESHKIIIFLREKKPSSQERTFLPQRFANERKADKNERNFFFICKRQMRQWHHKKQKNGIKTIFFTQSTSFCIKFKQSRCYVRQFFLRQLKWFYFDSFLIFFDFQLFQVRLGQVRLGQVRLGQVRLGQRLGQVRLGQVRLGQVRLGQVRLVQVRI